MRYMLVETFDGFKRSEVQTSVVDRSQIPLEKFDLSGDVGGANRFSRSRGTSSLIG